MSFAIPLIAQKILSRPLLVHSSVADVLYDMLEGRISGFSGETPAPEASRFAGSGRTTSGERLKFSKANGDTAIITIDGSLVNRGAFVGTDFCTGMVSYEGINAQIDEAISNADIRNMVLDINSYGGEASGMSGVAAKVRKARETMRVIAVVNDVAASAGYGIASGADEIWISETSLVGSIGVVMMHLDRSAEMVAKGIRPTFIFAGDKKVDGNSFGPLPEGVRADMQKDVLAFYDQFLGTVEAGRGKRLTAAMARATKADVFIGKDAIAQGLADRVGTVDDALAYLSRSATPGGSPQRSKTKMDLDQANAASATALQAARLEGEANGKIVGKADGITEGKVLGATAERERISAIVNSEEGKARPAAALTMALGEGALASATAIAVLGSLPKDAPLASNTPKTTPIEQRSESEVGADATVAAIAEQATAGWGKAVAKLNSKFN